MTVIGPATYKQILKFADADLPPSVIAAKTGVPVADVKRVVYKEAPLALDPRIEHMLTAAETSPRAAVRNLGAKLRAAYEQLAKELNRERVAAELKAREEELAQQLAGVRKQLRRNGVKPTDPQETTS